MLFHEKITQARGSGSGSGLGTHKVSRVTDRISDKNGEKLDGCWCNNSNDMRKEWLILCILACNGEN